MSAQSNIPTGSDSDFSATGLAPPERILVLDDEERISSLCSKMLTRMGYEVISPLFGPEAFETALLGQYDLLLTDYTMPEMNGVQLFREVQMAGHEVSAAIITAAASADILTDALEAGVSAFIPKPFTAEELRRGVELALAKVRMEKENARLRGMVALAELWFRLSPEPGWDAVFNLVRDIAGRTVMADRLSVMVCTEDSARLRVAAVYGSLPACAQGQLTDIDGTVSEYVLRNGEAVLINGGPVSAAVRPRLRCSDLSSGICVPLRSGSEVVGVLSAGREKPRSGFKKSDLKFLEGFATHLGQAYGDSANGHQLRDRWLQGAVDIIQEMESWEPCMKGHASRVAEYAVKVAEELGLSESGLDELRVAGLIHDVGRLGVPKRQRANPQEWTVTDMFRMKNHVQHSEKLLTASTLPETIVKTIRHHHEWFSGAGYPEGLSGEKIPLQSRILRVADSADAISSDRGHRPMYSAERFREELVAGRGSEFDPQVADAALRLHGRKALLYPSHPYYRTF